MLLKILAYIFLGLFGVASVIQLVFAFREQEILRRKEKFACLLFLSLFAICMFPTKPLIYVGSLLGLAGDILDLQPKTFILGVVAFFLGHICYMVFDIWEFLQFSVPVLMWIVFALTFIFIFLIVFFICIKDKTHSKFECVGQAIYFAILVTYLPVFIYTLIKCEDFVWLSLIGACFFICSDAILVKTHFGKKFKRYQFFIMGTYLIAELLIVLGFVLSI